jgi:hypothetical protein
MLSPCFLVTEWVVASFGVAFPGLSYSNPAFSLLEFGQLQSVQVMYVGLDNPAEAAKLGSSYEWYSLSSSTGLLLAVAFTICCAGLAS